MYIAVIAEERGATTHGDKIKTRGRLPLFGMILNKAPPRKRKNAHIVSPIFAPKANSI